MAVQRLRDAGIPVVAVGHKLGHIGEVMIVKEIPEGRSIHTVTLYLGPANQAEWQDRILALRPVRIIFNPGTEVPAFQAKARAQGIQVVIGCTLVMLSVGTY